MGLLTRVSKSVLDVAAELQVCGRRETPQVVLVVLGLTWLSIPIHRTLGEA